MRYSVADKKKQPNVYKVNFMKVDIYSVLHFEMLIDTVYTFGYLFVITIMNNIDICGAYYAYLHAYLLKIPM